MWTILIALKLLFLLDLLLVGSGLVLACLGLAEIVHRDISDALGHLFMVAYLGLGEAECVHFLTGGGWDLLIYCYSFLIERKIIIVTSLNLNDNA